MTDADLQQDLENDRAEFWSELPDDRYPLLEDLMAELKSVNNRNDANIKLVNVITDLGNQFGRLIDKLENDPFYDEDDIELNVYADPRWLAIGKTHLQTGVMCLKRAVSKPDDF